MGIKNRLTTLMTERDTNPNELAQKIGVRPSTIYSILQRDSSRIDIDLIVKISHALGITADELLIDELRELPAASSSSNTDIVKEELLGNYDLLDDDGRLLLLTQSRVLVKSGDYKRIKVSEELA